MSAPAKNGAPKARAPKIDFAAELEAATAEATEEANNRFAIAEAAIAVRPTALAPAAPSAAVRAVGEGVPAAGTSPALRVVGGAFDVRALVVGQTYDVPLALIDPNKYSPRHFYKSERVDETAISMDQKGQKVAANGFVTEAGRVQLIEGGTRLRGARANGAETLKIVIEEPPKDDLDLYLRAVAFHDERTNHTALDTAVLLKKLLEDGVCASQDELAEKVKINGSTPSKQQVSMYLRISRTIPERLLRLMSDHDATSSFSVAYELSALFAGDDVKQDPDRVEMIAEEIIRKVATDGMSVKDLKAEIGSKLAGPKPRQRSEATNVKFGDAKGVIKLFEARGQLDFSIKGLSAEKLPALKAHIEAICAGKISLDQPF
jgi:ParB family chromosome partitioning protein